MKRTILPLLLLAALPALAIDTFVFSTNAVDALCSPRPCPSVAPRLDTGVLLYGVIGLPDADRAKTGWYRVLPPERPAWATNHAARVTGYAIDGNAGIATTQVEWKEKKARPVRLDRDKVKAKIRELGYGEILDNWREQPIELVTWWFSEMNYVKGGAIAQAICQKFGWTEAQLEAFIDEVRE